MTRRVFRFGVGFGGSPTRSELVPKIRRAEETGFEVVSSADHLSSRFSVFPLLSTAAEVSSMRVSPIVLANDYRHPVIVARDSATLDILSEGRFELGIGTGWIKEQYDSAGIAYDRPKTRVDRLEEAIAVIKGCWSGEPFTFTGSHYQTEAITCPRPHQQPGPPLLIAGAGRRMLRLAGREADIVDISPLGPVASGFEHFATALATSGTRIADQLGWIREGAGDRFDDIEISLMAHHVEITNDVNALATELADACGSSPDEVLKSPHVFIGSVTRIVDLLIERRELYGISYVVFSSTDLEAVEPIVGHLAGT